MVMNFLDCQIRMECHLFTKEQVSNIDIGLLPPVSTPSKHHCNPDEDVDGVHVDPDGGVDRVKGGSSIVGRVVLCLVDHLLGVVEQEGAKL